MATSMVTEITLEEGFDYLLTHFEGQRLWPRTISTKTTEGRQVVVNGREETLARFKQASFLDCRISAYPLPSQLSSFVGVNLDMAPSIVMVDLDIGIFKTQRALQMALNRTLSGISQGDSNCQPTVIWSGGGYHILLVLDAFILESVDIFNNNRFGSNPSQKFLRFAEWFLTNGKCDPQHNKTVSFRNCMLRIPGSINFKNGQIVRIIQKWNGYRPSIKLLLEDFYVYLCSQRITELREKRKCQLQRHFGQSEYSGKRDRSSITRWIEKLLQTPITDYRKLAIWRILAPYLRNKRGLSYDESYNIIYNWLDKCNQVKKLDFNPHYRIKAALMGSQDFLPISREKLKDENYGLYRLLQENEVFTFEYS